jgi:tRNA(fMet)-specific endonuclease VapC
MNAFLQALTPFPIDSVDITSTYADIDAFSKGQHQKMPLPSDVNARKMGKNDLWIAATSVVLNATLLTSDNDFLHLSPHFIKLETIKFSPIR